jgi:O-methyltransferase
MCEFHERYFPDSANAVNDEFGFVNLDMDLYQPMLAELKFFLHRMISGGGVLLHDYFNLRYRQRKG